MIAVVQDAACPRSNGADKAEALDALAIARERISRTGRRRQRDRDAERNSRNLSAALIRWKRALTRLIDEHAALIAAAREVVQRARFGYETTRRGGRAGGWSWTRSMGSGGSDDTCDEYIERKCQLGGEHGLAPVWEPGTLFNFPRR